MITGSLVAIVTPMHEDGRLDAGRFRNLIDWHVSEGTDRKSTRLNSSHIQKSRMPSSA